MTPTLLRDLRLLQVLVNHPEDTDCQTLVRHLHRIGCRVDVEWPPAEVPPLWPDVIFLMIKQEMVAQYKSAWAEQHERGPALIIIVDYEDPTTLQTVLEMSPNAVIGKPIQPYGVLANLVVARQSKLHHVEHHQAIEKLERKLRSVKLISQAKAVLMNQHGISEEEAYRRLRSQAMANRVTTEDIAMSLISAGNLLKKSGLP